MPVRKDPTLKIGRLTPIREVEPLTNGRGYPIRMYLWKCDCGNEVVRRLGAVMNGNTHSCGCLRKEVTGAAHRSHGKSNSSRAYKAWKGMRRRCLFAGPRDFPLYQGRGIGICDEWSDFEVFLRDMGEPPQGMSLDRIDNNAGYSKSNCRWATAEQQASNQRRCKYVVVDGETLCFSHACRKIGVKRANAKQLAKRIGHQASIDRYRSMQ